MSAKLIHQYTPIGATIRYSDGTQRPPERHRKKLSAWENRNGSGRLICKQPAIRRGNTTIPATFTLFEGAYGGGGVTVLRVHRTYSVESDLQFAVMELPTLGSVRIMASAREDAELVHLAPNREAAMSWLRINHWPNAVLDEVIDQGRAAS